VTRPRRCLTWEPGGFPNITYNRCKKGKGMELTKKLGHPIGGKKREKGGKRI